MVRGEHWSPESTLGLEQAHTMPASPHHLGLPYLGVEMGKGAVDLGGCLCMEPDLGES